MTTFHPGLGAISAVFVLACASPSSAQPRGPAGPSADFHYQKALGAGAKVEVRNVNGPVVVEAGSGDALDAVAVKTGRPEDAARVTVVAREEGTTIILCALWPGEDASSCRAGGGGGSRHESHADVRVEFRLRVPAVVTSLAVRTVNGRITANGIHGEARLTTVNGPVDVDATGPIAVTTVNGNVTARAAAGNSVLLETTEGAISLSLPASASADVDAATVAGRITSDFGAVPPPTIPVMHAARFRIGAGGPVMTLHTTHGDVHVRRS